MQKKCGRFEKKIQWNYGKASVELCNRLSRQRLMKLYDEILERVMAVYEAK